MKNIGFTRFERTEDNQNTIEDDINDEIKTLNAQLERIDEEQNRNDSKTIKKQMIERILETI